MAGVGDRHTQNLLIEEATGTLVPIDFGYSFGTATAVLSIPELMPFRFTRQLLGALQPHDGRELLVAPMADAMRALAESRQLLGSILSIFMREPLAEWQREARLLDTVSSGGKKAAGSSSASGKSSGSGGEDLGPSSGLAEVEHRHIALKV